MDHTYGFFFCLFFLKRLWKLARLPCFRLPFFPPEIVEFKLLLKLLHPHVLLSLLLLAGGTSLARSGCWSVSSLPGGGLADGGLCYGQLFFTVLFILGF